MTGFPLFPEPASTIANGVDRLFLVMIGISGFFAVLIFGLILYFAVRYRRRGDRPRTPPAPSRALGLEALWSLGPLALLMGIFVLGATVYFDDSQVPPGAMDIYVVGKQWMWKIQHPEGRREINELHIPVGRPVELILASEDVIHSFFVPAFRVKHDVVPGRFQSLWFEATETGEYHLFCAEYCGTGHSRMIGRVVVMEPNDFQRWLESGDPPDEAADAIDASFDPSEAAEFVADDTPSAVEGERLFADFECRGCHVEEDRGPDLAGRFGRTVTLESGATARFDEAYFRRALLDPGGELVAGYSPSMPTYQGELTEWQILRLMSYVEGMTPSRVYETQ